jgi:NAD+ diphosphatase
MPFSLMIGCFGEALTDEVRRDEAELQDCRWFSREEVVSMLEKRHPDGLGVPPAGAIAHHLIRYWAENT